jgi:peptidoglycan/xylan/chitin deacetylase (PgdA/CDA1 family)
MPSQPIQPNFNSNLEQEDENTLKSTAKNHFWHAFLLVFILIFVLGAGYFSWVWFERQKLQNNIQNSIAKCQKDLSLFKQEFGQVEISCDLNPPDLNNSFNLFSLKTEASDFENNISNLGSITRQKYDQRLNELNQSKKNYQLAQETLSGLGYKNLPDMAQIQAKEAQVGTTEKMVLDKKMYETELANLQPINKRFTTLLEYKLNKFWAEYKITKKLGLEIPSQTNDLIQSYSLGNENTAVTLQNLPKFENPEQAINTAKLSTELTQNTLILTQNIYSKVQNSKDLEKIALADTTPKNFVNLPILMYHRIEDLSKVPKTEQSDARKAISITPEVFISQLDLLKEKGYETVNLDDIDQAIENQDQSFFNGKKVVISFDDGYPEHYDIAFKELKNRGFKGVFGVITEQVKDKQLGSVSIITWSKLKEMQDAGMQIMSHSSSHCALGSFKPQDGRGYQDGGDYRKCDLGSQKEVNYGKAGFDMMPIKQAEYELNESRKLILKKIGVDQPYFMFPYGAYNDEIFDIMFQNGFKLGLGVGGGPNVDLNNPFTLNRVTVIGNTKPGELAGWFGKI